MFLVVVRCSPFVVRFERRQPDSDSDSDSDDEEEEEEDNSATTTTCLTRPSD